MKKLIALILGVSLFSVNTWADIQMNYVKDGMKTSASSYSLAGSADPNYPLYINGKKVETTSEGYFSYYVSLAQGVNVFKFENTTANKTYRITRTKGSSTNSGNANFKTVNLVGEINKNHPTVRSRPDEANDDLILPYVKGTLLHIVAQNYEYYKTANGSYVYKDTVNLVNKKYGENSVNSIETAKDTISFNMNRSTEYDVEFAKDYIEVKLYDTQNKAVIPDSSDFDEISVENNTPATYTFYFNKGDNYVGFMAGYEGNKFTIKLNDRTVSPEKSLKGMKIVLDAGHGGTDNGTLGLGKVYEKTVNLAIVKYLYDYLTERGAIVTLTRKDDTFISLGDRTNIINTVMPDISVSVHCNSRNEWEDFGEKQGTLNLYSYDTPDRFVQKLTEYMDNTGYQKQNLALTRTTVCPAVLVETGYMSNPKEYQYLIKAENQKAMAEKIGNGIEKYFENILNQAENTLPFIDVSVDDWYYNAVKKVYENELFSGTTKRKFAPKSYITRGMLMEVLYRKEGMPSVEGKSKFEDVDPSAYFSNAVAWAEENDIVNGVTDGLFAPYEPMTREQVATVLYKYAKYKNADVTAQGDLSSFADINYISSWAEESLKWAVGSKIFVGNDGKLSPKAYITRAEMATVICSFYNI